jgi:hypothetical protein
MVTLRREEWDELTPEEKRAHLIAEERAVFGADVKHDKHGNPIEQGIGARGHETANHFRALATDEGVEVAEKQMAAAVKAGTFSPGGAAAAQREIELAIMRGEAKRGGTT